MRLSNHLQSKVRPLINRWGQLWTTRARDSGVAVPLYSVPLYHIIHHLRWFPPGFQPQKSGTRVPSHQAESAAQSGRLSLACCSRLMAMTGCRTSSVGLGGVKDSKRPVSLARGGQWRGTFESSYSLETLQHCIVHCISTLQFSFIELKGSEMTNPPPHKTRKLTYSK